MENTNYIAGVVKILESPKKKLIRNNILMTKFRAQLPQLKGTTIIELKVWGNLASDLSNYYKMNDYILIEGYLSLHDKKNTNQVTQTSKKIVITVSKLYPFLLTYDRENNKR